MKKLLLIIVLGLFLSSNVYADSSWLKFPMQGKETQNFNIKTAKEYGPNQYIVESVTTIDPGKILYQKKSIETLVEYCVKDPGIYNIPKELLTMGKITKAKYKTSSGIKPGQIQVHRLKNNNVMIAFEIPYFVFKGALYIFCLTDLEMKKSINSDEYTPERKQKIVRDNIQKLYKEEVFIRYIDCRRKMRGVEIGGEVKWYPLKEDTNGYFWNEELCKILDS